MKNGTEKNENKTCNKKRGRQKNTRKESPRTENAVMKSVISVRLLKTE